MDSRIKFAIGIIFCLIGVIILISSLFFVKMFIPGGFLSLAIGLILISESRKIINKEKKKKI